MTYDEFKALPVGTVAAHNHAAFFKVEMNLGLGQRNWVSTAGSSWNDFEMFDLLDDQILPVMIGEMRILRTGLSRS
jgi:hypothetical protein